MTYTLLDALHAPANAPEAPLAATGVPRYVVGTSSPLAEMYRVAILDPAPSTPTEYLVWAADENDRFFWAKNDRYRRRFDWDGRAQRWTPLKGSPPVRLEASTGTLTLWTPTFPVGFLLTGLLRVGLAPDDSAIGLTAEVVPDSEVETFDADVVVGQTTGKYRISETLRAQYPGDLWYSPVAFGSDTGYLGTGGEGLHLAPSPLVGEYPIIQRGNRSPLTPIVYETDALLSTAPDPRASEVLISRSSGKLRLLNDTSTPVIYLGCACSAPQGLRAPTLIGTAGAALAVPLSYSWQTSGIFELPDPTGIPIQTSGAASMRPGGDSSTEPAPGRVRGFDCQPEQVRVYTSAGAAQTVLFVDRLADIQGLDKASETVAIVREAPSSAHLSRDLEKAWEGLPVYFQQRVLTPALEEPVARVSHVYRFASGALISVDVTGTTQTWTVPALQAGKALSAQAAASLIASAIPGVRAVGPSLLLPAAATVLPETTWPGFLPGWTTGGPNPDSGISFTFQGQGAFKTLASVTDYTLSDKVPVSPVLLLDHDPLLDRPYEFALISAGSEESTSTKQTLTDYRLLPGSLEWTRAITLSETAKTPVESVGLGDDVIPETVSLTGVAHDGLRIQAGTVTATRSLYPRVAKGSNGRWVNGQLRDQLLGVIETTPGQRLKFGDDHFIVPDVQERALGGAWELFGVIDPQVDESLLVDTYYEPFQSVVDPFTLILTVPYLATGWNGPKQTPMAFLDADHNFIDGVIVDEVNWRIEESGSKPAYLVFKLSDNYGRFSPQAGALRLNSPLVEGSTIRALCYLADSEGRRQGDPTISRATFPRKVVATRVSSTKYVVDLRGLTLLEGSLVVRAGINVLNYGGANDCTTTVTSSQELVITFTQAIPTTVAPDVITVLFRTYEAPQGAQDTTFDKAPIWSPPFFIPKGATRFGLRADRRADLPLGTTLRLNDDCIRVTGLKYHAAQDITEVTFQPPCTTKELGSRSTQNASLWTVRKAPNWVTLGKPYLAAVGGDSLELLDDLPFPVVPGHWIELAGNVYVIKTVSDRTLTLTAPLLHNTGTLKVSAQPVYPAGTTTISIAKTPLTAELLKFPAGSITGRALRPLIDYLSGPGVIQLVDPLAPGDRLHLVRVEPVTIKKGTPFTLTATARVTPQAPILGATLVGSYSFACPDSYYGRAAPTAPVNAQLLDELKKEEEARAQSKPAGGPLLFSRGGSKTWDHGALAPAGKARQKRLTLQALLTAVADGHHHISRFERLIEIGNGQLVGDRDGQPKFPRQTEGRLYPAPGDLDAITGETSPNYLWAKVVHARSGIYVAETDPLLDPDKGLAVVNGELVGERLSADRLEELLEAQRAYVTNDLLDRVLTKIGKVTRRRTLTLPFFEIRVSGTVEKITENHRFSRLRPTRTRAFFQTLPGAGAGDGVYTAGRVIDGAFVRTTGSQIGQLANPVIGDIQNVSTAQLQRRVARAQILSYRPEGIPSWGITSPCILAAPAGTPLDANGLPDRTSFVSQGGSIPDLVSGDADLLTPGFQIGDQITLGKPDGRFLALSTPSSVVIWGAETPSGVFVNELLFGCVATLKDNVGDPVTNLLADGLPAVIEQGDTLLATVSPQRLPTQELDLDTAPTMSTLLEASGGSYRLGVDYRLTPKGEILDATLPSIFDGVSPLGQKELTGQNPIPPMTTVEGLVEFTSGTRDLAPLPALEGKALDDSGDRTMPYLYADNELRILQELSNNAPDIFELAGPTLNEAAKPQEIIASDVTVAPDGTFTTTANFLPGTTTGNAHQFDPLWIEVPVAAGFSASGASTWGPHGFHSIGAVTADTVEPPRFIVPTKAGTPLRYTLDNAMAYVSGSYPANPRGQGLKGATITETPTYTAFNFGDLPLCLDNGGPVPGIGGLQDLIDAGCIVRIRIFARPDSLIEFGFDGPALLPGDTATEILWIALWQGNAVLQTYQDSAPSASIAASAVFNRNELAIMGTGLIPWTPAVLPPGWDPDKWVIPYSGAGTKTSAYAFEFSIDIDASGVRPWIVGESPSWASNTAWITSDRLTFVESYALNMAPPRGTTHTLSGRSFAAALAITGTPIGITSATKCWSSINNGVNGNGVPLTFRSAGTWTDGQGTLRASGWDGSGNTPVTTTTPATLAVLPTCAYEGTTKILETTGLMGNNRVSALAADTHRARPGDFLVVRESTNGSAPGTIHAGTYLIRDVVHSADPISPSGEIGFPTLLHYDAGSLNLSSNPGFNPGDRLWLILDLGALESTAPETNRWAALSAEILTITPPATFTVTNWQDARGTGLTVAQAEAHITLGVPCSGFPSFPLSLTRVGVASRLTLAYKGRTLYARTPGTPAPASALDLNVTYSTTTWATGATWSTQTPYAGVPKTVTFDAADLTPLGLPCYLPGTLWTLASPASDTGPLVPGYTPEAGIFLEPSYPRSALPLIGSRARVVDASHSLLPSPLDAVREYGTRLLATTWQSGDAAAAALEVKVSVRRGRRFALTHLNLTDLNRRYQALMAEIQEIGADLLTGNLPEELRAVAEAAIAQALVYAEWFAEIPGWTGGYAHVQAEERAARLLETSPLDPKVLSLRAGVDPAPVPGVAARLGWLAEQEQELNRLLAGLRAARLAYLSRAVE